MRPFRKAVPMVMVSLVFLVGMVSVSAAQQPAKSPPEECVTMEVIPEAKIVQFESELGTQGEDPALVFTVGIENTSNQPMRFRLSIFLQDMDKGAGSLIPTKGNPPVLEPGKTETVKIPFLKTDKESKDILVVVTQAGY